MKPMELTSAKSEISTVWSLKLKLRLSFEYPNFELKGLKDLRLAVAIQ